MTKSRSQHEANLYALDDLIATGEGFLEARRNPAVWVKSLGDFGDAYQRWKTAGQDLIARLSGPASAREWTFGWCFAMHSMDQDPAYCLEEQQRQQAMLTELRARFEASKRAKGRPTTRAKRVPVREPDPLPSPPAAPAAATPAGAPPADKPRYLIRPDNRELTNEQVLADVQRVANALSKKTLTLSEYMRHGKCGATLINGRFGSWNNALRAAGLEVGIRKSVPTEELFENLARVWESWAASRPEWRCGNRFRHSPSSRTSGVSGAGAAR